MRTLFIGDLHLSADRPDITRAFNDFLDNQLDDVQALYILGDLFEVWIGDDLAEPFAIDLAKKLYRLSKSMPVYYIHGNRDFLLGKEYANKAGMTLLPETHCIDLYGVPTVILHGDSLCTLDKAYQRFRRFRNLKLAKWIYSHLPRDTRKNIARNIRSKSTQSNMQKNVSIMDVEQEAVSALLDSTQTVQMIHGHTHRPDIHEMKSSSGITRKRIVVGDWYEQASVLSVSANKLDLSVIPFEK
ncbi:UDP-2,3-diacylglucosamine diphosphatase [Shewanella atlantica]|uniref:UDP-2,3-diacylglucosamine hydrolase n=1 Tax=Shewanella atlantica TaxID=271099 RepID=A0A3S0IHS8_9GAMM|nr:UDP-2,3-diacylglucosamine diphosphatase [Shewanella atlantica]RTR34347.1 UDP-2,3-diacylglucosamine diphosphatase [Shewanella atlantica]